jgi:hypothetical protein
VVVAEEAFGLGAVLEGVEQHCLAHPAQAADDHALLCRPSFEATDEYPELLELLIAAGQFGWVRAPFGVYGLRMGSILYRPISGYKRLGYNRL